MPTTRKPLSPVQQLAELTLGQPVVPWVKAQRRKGMTWRAIAAELDCLTGGRANVTQQTLINWVGK